MTETFFTVEQSSYAAAVLMGLKKELARQIRCCEIPEMLSAHECVRQGKKHGLLTAVACQRECGNTGHLNCTAAA